MATLTSRHFTLPGLVLISVDIAVTGSPELTRLAERLVAVADPDVMAALIRQAVADTFLVAIRRRFYAGLAEAVRTQRVQTSTDDTPVSPRLSRQAQKIASALTQAQLDGDATAATRLEAELAQVHATVRDDIETLDSPLSSGRFRSLALEVLNLMTQVESVGVGTEDGNVVVGIAPLAPMNEIETPSHSASTSSAMTTMWRQLEFGTGIYATDPEGNPGSPFKEDDGTWWYGRAKHKGIHLQGAPGVHALFTTDGLAYDDDALRFESVFARLMAERLSV